MYKDIVKKAYAIHKSGAKHRGIPFLLTYEQWCMLWMESGKWEQRGRHRGKYVMRRFEDKGAYELGNVEICVARENTAERNRNYKITGQQHHNYGKNLWAACSETGRENIRKSSIIRAASRTRDARGCFITEKSNGIGLPPGT